MDSKYIFVNIRIPLETKPDGSYDVISERMILEIEPCEKLPPVNTSENDRVLFEQMYLTRHSGRAKEEEKTIFVFDTKIAQGKTRQNITIHNRSNKSTHFTRKKYESDLNSDTVVGSVPQLTVLEESLEFGPSRSN